MPFGRDIMREKAYKLMQLSLYLSYIYYRRLFAKGDLLTIAVLITAMAGALYVLYLHYVSWSWLLILFPLATLSYHNSREDLPLLCTHPHYRSVLLGEYGIENLPFILLLIGKGDYLWAALYFFGLCLIPWLTQRQLTIPYPFSLSDPLWHTTFRKYKLLFSLPFLIGLVVIAGVYNNPNLALFAFGAMGIVCCMPYFEREHPSYITIAAQRGKDYLHSQLIAGIKNTALVFSPLGLTYLICFGIDEIAVLFLCLGVAIVGVLTKYAFFNQPLPQSFAIMAIFLGVFYIFPLLLLPYFYFLAIQNIQKYQHVTDKSLRKELPR